MNVSLRGIINGFGDLLLDHLRCNLPNLVPVYKRAIAQINPALHADRFTKDDLEVISESFSAYQTVRKVEYTFCDAAAYDFTSRLQSPVVPPFTMPLIDDRASFLARDFIAALLEEKLIICKPKAAPAHIMKVYEYVIAIHTCPLAQEL